MRQPKILKAREGLLAGRPAVYICVILLSAFASLVHWVRSDTIFSCRAGGYTTDRYLAYCNGRSYADYEHGAFQFDLEPSVEDFAKSADVLFLGNSRVQIGFSTAATADWFSTASARYYLLGFSYFENMVFTEELLRKIRPKATVYVINVDGFFVRKESDPAKTVLHDPAARRRYEVKRLWQRAHEPICQALGVLCGDRFGIFRSRETGAYHLEGKLRQKAVPVSYDEVVDQDVVDSNAAAAVDFLSHFAQGKCVILTMVPFVGTTLGTADAIAKRLGTELVIPGIVEGLRTFDGVHLDEPSAARWSQAFFQAAGPRIRSCLKERGAAPA